MRVERFQPTNLFTLADKMLSSFEKFKTAYFAEVKEVNAQDSFGFTLLHYAVARGRVDIVEFLLEQGASPTVENWLNLTPLAMSVQDEKKDIKEKLEIALKQTSLPEETVPLLNQEPQKTVVKLSFGAPAPWRLAV